MIFCVTVSNCLIVNRGIVSPTPVHVNPTFIVNPCNFLGVLVDYRFSVLQLLSLSNGFSFKFQSSMKIFHHKLLTGEGRVLANG